MKFTELAALQALPLQLRYHNLLVVLVAKPEARALGDRTHLYTCIGVWGGILFRDLLLPLRVGAPSSLTKALL